MTTFPLFAVSPPGLESSVAAELEEHGFSDVVIVRGGVNFTGNPIRANRRLACPSRILQRISRFKCFTFAQLEAGIEKVDWSAWDGFTPQAVCHASRIYHSGAVEERLAKLLPPGELMLQVRIVRNRCILSVDTSGELLHRRGWRLEPGKAPVRENLAAGILHLAGWKPGEPLYDPMCGSGTFLIEAAGNAAGLDPGRLRTFPCEDWATAATLEKNNAVETVIIGGDISASVIESATKNAARAGVEIGLQVQGAGDARAPDGPPGLLVCNPPYGRRVGSGKSLETLSRLLNGSFSEWRAALLCPAGLPDDRFGRPVHGRHSLKNGGLSVELILLGSRQGT